MNRRIKINIVFATLFFMLLSFSSVQAQVQKAHYNTYISSYSNGFYDYLPQGYSATGTTLYPVIIFIHGSWETGSGSTTDLPKVLKHGPPKLISKGQFPTSFTLNGKTFKFIVFSPQMRSSSAGAAAINTVIDYVVKHYKVDVSRIYLTGLSSGGGTVENAAADAAVGKRVAAVLEFAGSGSPSITKAANIVANNIPFWGIHNKYDDAVAYTKTVNWVGDILSLKSTFATKKTIPNASGHDCWTARYVPTYTENGLNVYQWMLQYKKGTTVSTNTPPVAKAGSDKTIYLPTSSVTLSGSGTDANGSISKYSWTKVSGPSSYSFSSTSSTSPTVSSLTAGTYIFRLTVTDNGGATDYDDVNVVVKSPMAIPGKVEAENYSTMSGIKTETTTDVGGGQSVGAIDQGDWMAYSVKASSSGTYTVTFRVASPNTGAQFQVKNSGGTVLATVNVPNTGGWQTWKDVTAKVTLPSGTQTLKLYSTNAALWNINYANFATGTTSSTTTGTKVEAESYAGMTGVQKETTTDAGGGQDVTAIDLNDWMYYNLNIASAGTYTFTFRLASAVTGAKFEVYDSYNSVKTKVATITVPNTGGTQVWKNVTASVGLKAGAHAITLYSIAAAHWNINYFTYGSSTGTTTSTAIATNVTNTAIAEEGITTTASALAVAPNPFSNQFVLQVNNKYTGTMKVQLIDQSGVVRKQFQVIKSTTGTMQTYLSAGTLTKGTYVLRVQVGDWTQSVQVVKL